MRKAFGFTVLIFCSLLYIASCNQAISKKIYIYKTKAIPAFRSDRWSYGDLYGMSYLPYFRTHYKNDVTTIPIECQHSAKVDLYTICDSYLWKFFPSNKFYCSVNKLTIAKTNYLDKLKINLDQSKINVLLIEFSEMNVRNILHDTSYIDNVIAGAHENLEINTTNPKISSIATGRNLSIGNKITLTGRWIKSVLNDIQKISADIFGFIFNDKINANIEANTWDISLFTPIRELKATMNYKLFNTIDDKVKLSKDGRQLFYPPTIDTSSWKSSFKPFSEAEKDTLVSRLNLIYFKGKNLGFYRVYLSLIPNPVSILDPNFDGLKYNDLVNRIQSDKNLKIPFINILPAFKDLKSAAYSASDTHWNHNGANTWLNMFNNELNKLNIDHPDKE